MKGILVIITLAIAGSVLAFGSEGGRQEAPGSPGLLSFPTQDGGA